MKFNLHVAWRLLPALFPAAALASTCNVPAFETFIPKVTSRPGAEAPYIELGMEPVARLRIPGGFTRWGTLPYGSVVFGAHPKGISGGIAYETRATLAVHLNTISPAKFMASVFKGLDGTGCRYLAGQQLEDQDYRLHTQYANGAELFAFGKSGKHHFYLIRSDKPDYVLNGLFKGISRAEFESILSTIHFQ